MKKLFVLSFVAALSVAGCSKKKANTTPTNATPATEEKAADPTATPADGTTPAADPCAGQGKTADPCAAPKK
jgi:hypothetical protein